MAKSWKKLVNTTDSDSNGAGGENSWNNSQLTLDEIGSQNPALDNLIKERQALENNMSNLIQPSDPAAEDPRFAGNIDSFKVKREKEQQRAAQKKKLEERITLKSKELEKWEQTQERLKEKLTHHKKLLKKQETEQDPSTSLKAPKSKEKDSERKWFSTDFIRKNKDVIGKKNEVQSELNKAKTKVSDEIERRRAAASDIFGQKDLAKFQQKLDQKNTPEINPKRIQSLKDTWAKIRETKKDDLKEELKEKIAIQKLSDKLAEAKRFKSLSDLDNLTDSSPLKDPKIRDLDTKQEKEKTLDDRPKSTEDKKEEQQEMSRREKRKQKREERRKRDSDEPRERRKKKKDDSETERQTPESEDPSAKRDEQKEAEREKRKEERKNRKKEDDPDAGKDPNETDRQRRKREREESRDERRAEKSDKKDEQRETDRREKQKEESLSRRKAERKEEERSNRMKERKKDKYD